jgi:hypothetical protein
MRSAWGAMGMWWRSKKLVMGLSALAETAGSWARRLHCDCASSKARCNSAFFEPFPCCGLR